MEIIQGLNMSTPTEKMKNSSRRFSDEVAIKKQEKIAKTRNHTGKAVKEPHRYNKHHAMDCGRPGCMLCGNPRKIFKEKTIQEQRFYQDPDMPNDKHSNGSVQPPEDQD
jgi:hypothetical protein